MIGVEAKPHKKTRQYLGASAKYRHTYTLEGNMGSCLEPSIHLSSPHRECEHCPCTPRHQESCWESERPSIKRQTTWLITTEHKHKQIARARRKWKTKRIHHTLEKGAYNHIMDKIKHRCGRVIVVANWIAYAFAQSNHGSPVVLYQLNTDTKWAINGFVMTTRLADGRHQRTHSAGIGHEKNHSLRGHGGQLGHRPWGWHRYRDPCEIHQSSANAVGVLPWRVVRAAPARFDRVARKFVCIFYE